MIPYWITTIHGCKIGIAACPSKETPAEDIEALMLPKSSIIVSLLAVGELEKLGLSDEKSICEERDLEFIHFPIPDTNIPHYPKYVQFIRELYTKIKDCKTLLIHCQHGIGRSSLIAIGILLKHQLDLKTSIQLVRKARCQKLDVPIPQSASQKKMLRLYWSSPK